MPDHAQTGESPPVSIEAAKGLWHCFGCGAGGSAVALFEALGMNTAAAVEEVKRRAGLSDDNAPWILNRSQRSQRPQPAQTKQRQTVPLSEERRARWLRRFIADRGWRDETAARLRLSVETDRRGYVRVWFPFFRAGEEVYRQGRVIGEVEDGRPRWMGSTGKIPCPYNTDDGLALGRRYGEVFVVEGITDCVTLLDRCDPIPVVGIPGADGFKDHWAKAFADLAVWVIGDNDEGGQTFRAQVERVLTDHVRTVRHVWVPPGPLDDAGRDARSRSYRRRCT